MVRHYYTKLSFFLSIPQILRYLKQNNIQPLADIVTAAYQGLSLTILVLRFNSIYNLFQAQNSNCVCLVSTNFFQYVQLML